MALVVALSHRRGCASVWLTSLAVMMPVLTVVEAVGKLVVVADTSTSKSTCDTHTVTNIENKN